MATICFTWELGQGFGHLIRYRNLIEQLIADGHCVSFLAKNATSAARVFEGLKVSIIGVEPGSTPQAHRLPFLNSYPDILYNFGFYDSEALLPQVDRWQQIFADIQPDILIIDHSPSALLASRALACPVISSGSGFTVPPRATPMKPLRYWTMRHREHLLAREQHVLAVCNEVLRRCGEKTLDSLCELLNTGNEWLATFPELDHYGERRDGQYLGTFFSSGFGAAARWHAVTGPRVFAYLPAPALADELLGALTAVEANLCVYAPNMPATELEKLPPDRTVKMLEPVELATVAERAEVVLTNGGLNTVAGFLHAGVPQLALPNNMERHLVGRRLELTGGGLMAPLNRAENAGKMLYALVHDRAFKRAAERFAERYAAHTASRQTSAMVADIERLLR